MMKRSFTIQRTEVKLPEDGTFRYESVSPYAAAAKAARRIFREAENQKLKKKEIRFTLRETTLGSQQKEFTYVATKQKLDTPKPLMVKGVQVMRVTKDGKKEPVVYEYSYSVKSCRR